MTEIASEFGCHPTTIHYALKAMGYTRKKKNYTYYEQDPEKVALFLKNFNSLKHLAPV
ncbi:putative IS630-Spn1 transposase [Streptococcus pneumoniae EU-NP01]|nr:putative IS630-Spn1 transposase [Streptococcus pneumoniae EU-NP01]